MAGVEIRKLTERDIDAALQLTDLEGWGYNRADWLRLLALAPGGCFGAQRDEELVGVLSTTSYGKAAYLGSVIVQNKLRGQGIVAAMMRAALDHLDRNDVETVRLNAYLHVVPFYEKLGFRKEHPNMRWEGALHNASWSGIHPLREKDLEGVIATDAAYFGSPRGILIRHLAQEFPATFLVAEERGTIRGYIVGNASGEGCEIGPWIVEEGNPRVARELLEALLHSAGAGTYAFTAPGPNTDVHSLAREAGLQESVRYRTLRMVRGADAYGGRPEGIWALGGLDKG